MGGRFCGTNVDARAISYFFTDSPAAHPLLCELTFLLTTDPKTFPFQESHPNLSSAKRSSSLLPYHRLAWPSQQWKTSRRPHRRKVRTVRSVWAPLHWFRPVTDNSQTSLDATSGIVDGSVRFLVGRKEGPLCGWALWGRYTHWCKQKGLGNHFSINKNT